MTAQELLLQLREMGVKLKTANGQRLAIDAPKGSITPELREQLTARKGELLHILQNEEQAVEAQVSAPDEPGQSSMLSAEALPPSQPVPLDQAAGKDIARFEAELTRLRTEEEARRAEVEVARLAAENALRLEQERWQHAEHETALRRAEKEKQRIEAEARDWAIEETRRQFTEDEIARVEDEARRMHEAEQSRRSDFEAQMRAAEETHRLQIESLRKAEEDQARRRIEEERRYLDLMMKNKAQEDEHRRAAEQRMQKIEEEILRIRAVEAAHEHAAQEARRLAAEAARKRAEEDVRRAAEAEALRRAEEEARLRAEVETQLRAEAEARWRVEDETRRRSEEQARRRAQEEVERLAALEGRRLAEAEDKRRTEALARQKEEAEVRRKADEKARREAETQERLRLESEARDRASATVRGRAQTEIRIREEVAAKIRAEEEERKRMQSREFSAPQEPNVMAIDAVFTTNSGQEVESQDEFRAISLPEGVEFGESDIAAPTRNALGSHAANERARAVAELAASGGEDAFQFICGAFDDEAAPVRIAAARALSEFQGDRAAAFTRALREALPERRLRIGVAIAASGLANAAIESLTGDSRDKTYDAFSLLFLMSKAGEIQPLMGAIEAHPNNEIRLAAIKLLALSSAPNVLPAFRQMADRGSLPAEVRSALTDAIHEITGEARAESART
jgi:hypothetical protein